ncbi:hypothetical protein GXW78_17500 [Roseomonas terrae]|uniref:Outer membrane protein beta-barrel domain-containing protein n=1 Tax=Neoroseomonas terrae TaxID=424799 RepID=A0ABS5EKH6_9PROT|nr:hypothetical protein [Neoroseomonas terrae]MBR0651470.1 hypothetical protein [Neoroseomonas terrae]
MAGIGGEATLRGRALDGARTERVVGTTADFGDVLGNLKMAFMGAAEARYGRFALLADLLYLDLENGISTPRDRLYAGGSASVRTTGAGFVAMVRPVDETAWSLDAGAGVRPWWVDTKLRLNPGLAQGRTIGSSVNWTDPVIALRGRVRLSEQVSLTAYGDVGGFGVGSNLTWQVIGSVDWQPDDWLVLRAGWRYLSFDFGNASSSLNLAISGPIIGASFRF